MDAVGQPQLFAEPVFVAYKLINGKTGAAYIGITSKGAEQRWRGHLKAHRGGQDSVLYRAMRKYGHKVFTVQILAICHAADELPALEIRLIQEHGTFVADGGYNMTRGGEGSPIICDETRQNMRAAAKRRCADPAVREKISKTLKGRKLSPEHIAASARGRMGKPLTEAHREKISAAHRGHSNLSLESRAKIAETLRGRPPPPQALEAAKRVNTGKKRSDETKRRISEALARPETRAKKSYNSKRMWARRRAAVGNTLSPRPPTG